MPEGTFDAEVAALEELLDAVGVPDAVVDDAVDDAVDTAVVLPPPHAVRPNPMATTQKHRVRCVSCRYPVMSSLFYVCRSSRITATKGVIGGGEPSGALIGARCRQIAVTDHVILEPGAARPSFDGLARRRESNNACADCTNCLQPRTGTAWRKVGRDRLSNRRAHDS